MREKYLFFLLFFLFSFSFFLFPQKVIDSEEYREEKREKTYSKWNIFIGPNFVVYDVREFTNFDNWSGIFFANFGIEKELKESFYLQTSISFSRIKNNNELSKQVTYIDLNGLFSTGIGFLNGDFMKTYFLSGLGVNHRSDFGDKTGESKKSL